MVDAVHTTYHNALNVNARCVQDFVALGNENCNAALVCLSSGSWITSNLRNIDYDAIFVLNVIQKELTEHLCFFMISFED